MIFKSYGTGIKSYLKKPMFLEFGELLMVIIQSKSRRKTTGGRYTQARSKRLFESGGQPMLTKFETRKIKSIRTQGNNSKLKVMSETTVNLSDPKTKKTSKVAIKSVIDNPASRHFTRRSIMTKGAIIETEMGKARVTSRPGQEGAINAILI